MICFFASNTHTDFCFASVRLKIQRCKKPKWVPYYHLKNPLFRQNPHSFCSLIHFFFALGIAKALHFLNPLLSSASSCVRKPLTFVWLFFKLPFHLLPLRGCRLYVFFTRLPTKRGSLSVARAAPPLRPAHTPSPRTGHGFHPTRRSPPAYKGTWRGARGANLISISVSAVLTKRPAGERKKTNSELRGPKSVTSNYTGATRGQRACAGRDGPPAPRLLPPNFPPRLVT